MQVTADLTFEVDGIVSTVTGDGSVLVLHSADPVGVLGSLAGAALPTAMGRLDGPRTIGWAADELDSLGLRVELTGPDGVYLTLGRGAGSRAGRLVTRSSHVQPGRMVALRPLVGAELARRAHRPAGVAVIVAAVAAGVAAVRRVVRRRATGS